MKMTSLCRICKTEPATRRIVTWDLRGTEFSLSLGNDICNKCGMEELKKLNPHKEINLNSKRYDDID